MIEVTCRLSTLGVDVPQHCESGLVASPNPLDVFLKCRPADLDQETLQEL